MNKNILNKLAYSVITAAAIFTLSACGSPKSNSDVGDNSVQMSGLVVDDYLAGSIVFIDVDDNAKVDDYDKFVVTDSDGKFSNLDLNPKVLDNNPDVRAYAIAGFNKLTLEKLPSALSFRLKDLQVGQNEFMITPMTTLLASMEEEAIEKLVESLNERYDTNFTRETLASDFINSDEITDEAERRIITATAMKLQKTTEIYTQKVEQDGLELEDVDKTQITNLIYDAIAQEINASLVSGINPDALEEAFGIENGTLKFLNNIQSSTRSLRNDSLADRLIVAGEDSTLVVHVSDLVDTLEEKSKEDKNIKNLLLGAESVAEQIKRIVKEGDGNIERAKELFDKEEDIEGVFFEYLNDNIAAGKSIDESLQNSIAEVFGELNNTKISAVDSQSDEKLYLQFDGTRDGGNIYVCQSDKDGDIQGDTVEVDGTEKHKPLKAKWEMISDNALVLDYAGKTARVVLLSSSPFTIRAEGTEGEEIEYTGTGTADKVIVTEVPEYCEDVMTF